MKILHSFWSLPSERNSCGNDEGRHAGGWISEKYHAMSWALSCLQWKKHYGKITLYTDEIGKSWLIDKLNLPYNEIVCTLDELNAYNPLLWALPKVHVYGQQEEPFIHVDGDVYIWGKLDKSFDNKKFICQNYEYNHAYYEEILREIKNNFNYIPDELSFCDDELGLVKSINAGIIGGSDLKFFKDYSKNAFEFINKNIDQLSYVNTGMLNVVFEQLLFSRMLEEKGEEAHTLFKKVSTNFSELMQFNSVPIINKYIHLVGFGKKNISCCMQLEAHLKFNFPNIHEHICSLYPKTYNSLPSHQNNISRYQYSLNYARAMGFNEQLNTESDLHLFVDNINPDSCENKMLHDLFTIESAMNILTQHIYLIQNCVNEKKDDNPLQHNYENNLESFSKLSLEINRNSCQILYLYHDFDNINLPYDLEEIVSFKKMLLPNSSNKIFMLYYDLATSRIKYERLDAWQLLLVYFDGNPLQVEDIVKIIESGQSLLKYKGDNLLRDVVSFITANVVLNNFLKISTEIPVIDL